MRGPVQYRISDTGTRITIPAGQDMAQVRPLQMSRRMRVIGKNIFKPVSGGYQ